MIARMDAWIQAQDNATPGAFAFRIVFNLQEASRMRENNAHEAMRGAEREYPAYAWTMVRTDARDTFLVQGEKKKKPGGQE